MRAVSQAEWEDIADRLDRMSEDCGEIQKLLGDRKGDPALVVGFVNDIEHRVSQALKLSGKYTDPEEGA